MQDYFWLHGSASRMVSEAEIPVFVTERTEDEFDPFSDELFRDVLAEESAYARSVTMSALAWVGTEFGELAYRHALAEHLANVVENQGISLSPCDRAALNFVEDRCLELTRLGAK